MALGLWHQHQQQAAHLALGLPVRLSGLLRRCLVLRLLEGGKGENGRRRRGKEERRMGGMEGEEERRRGRGVPTWSLAASWASVSSPGDPSCSLFSSHSWGGGGEEEDEEQEEECHLVPVPGLLLLPAEGEGEPVVGGLAARLLPLVELVVHEHSVPLDVPQGLPHHLGGGG